MNFTPISPFEPISATNIPTGDEWIAQIKWDGVRMLTYYDGSQVRLYNRKLNERSMQYPELLQPERYCQSSSFIVDGELIAFDENKPSFHEIMKRDSLRNEQSINRATTLTPVTYMIFDVLYAEGEWLMDLPLTERLERLHAMIKPQANIQIVQNFNDPAGLLDVMRTHQMEGIVCKKRTSTYAIAGKDNRWQKVKIFYDLYAVIGGVILKHNTVNSLLLGLYDEHGAFIYIGHAGTGKLSTKERLDLASRIAPTALPNMPFNNTPERNKDTVWIAPQVVVKVQYMEWTPGQTMRHPTTQAIIKDMETKDCTFRQLN